MLSMTAFIDDMAHLYDYHLYGRTSACDYWLQSVWMSGNISLCLAVQSIEYFSGLLLDLFHVFVYEIKKTFSVVKHFFKALQCL